jgi:hypothetical protein
MSNRWRKPRCLRGRCRSSRCVRHRTAREARGLHALRGRQASADTTARSNRFIQVYVRPMTIRPARQCSSTLGSASAIEIRSCIARHDEGRLISADREMERPSRQDDHPAFCVTFWVTQVTGHAPRVDSPRTVSPSRRAQSASAAPLYEGPSSQAGGAGGHPRLARWRRCWEKLRIRWSVSATADCKAPGFWCLVPFQLVLPRGRLECTSHLLAASFSGLWSDKLERH